MMEAGTGWTDERVALLARLWGEGLSASQIAGALGGGVTRNAVIGKVHRLGLAARSKPGQPAPQRSPKARPQPQVAAAADPARPALGAGVDLLSAEEADGAEELAIPISERVTILELRDSMCRWPLGDPTSAEFGFCGGRTVTGLPYCSHHCRVAYQPTADRRRIRAY